MTSIIKSIIGAVLVICSIAPALAQEQTPSPGTSCGDGCPPAPVAASLVAENELVQVLRVSIPAHARTPMHDLTPRVVVWLADAHFVDRYPDGKVVDETRKAGDAEWVPARRHSGENLSDRPMEFIAVVLKRAASAGRDAPEGHSQLEGHSHQ
jgi:hypothetical protein